MRPTDNQVDDLLEEINGCVHKGQRVLVTTLTKRMAEELSKYFDRIGIRNRYIHSDVDTFDRVQILEDLKAGSFDVLVGVNLLREGLDLPEVALVAILDADKEGFLRNEKSLTQTAGRAARNVEGRVIMYADKITPAMRATIAESERRRAKQMAYNEAHGITPTQIKRYTRTTISGTTSSQGPEPYPLGGSVGQMAAESRSVYSAAEREGAIQDARRRMEEAAKALDFAQAAIWRDRMYELQGKK